MNASVARWTRRAWKEYADLRRRATRAGSARPALDGLRASRSDVEAWNRETRRRHDEYRRRCPVTPGDVAVVCVSQRPERIADVVDNVARQSHRVSELVYVSNLDDDAPLAAAESTFARLDGVVDRVTVLRRDEAVSLGHCLNAALERAESRFVAKFDDDDHYGGEYLADASRAHGYAGAGVVGKHSTYVHLEHDDETVLRFPAHEFLYTSTLAGPSLVIDRDRAGSVRFRDVSLGEDRAFIADCNRRGISTFSADRFNLAIGRGSQNTWQVDDDWYRVGTIPVGSGRRLDEIDL